MSPNPQPTPDCNLSGLPPGLLLPRQPASDGTAVRSYHQSSADLARGLEIRACPLGSLPPELIDEFLQWRAQQLQARPRSGARA